MIQLHAPIIPVDHFPGTERAMIGTPETRIMRLEQNKCRRKELICTSANRAIARMKILVFFVARFSLDEIVGHYVTLDQNDTYLTIEIIGQKLFQQLCSSAYHWALFLP